MRAPHVWFFAQLAVSSALLMVPTAAGAADLILNGGSVTLTGSQVYGIVSLTNGAKVTVKAVDGSMNTVPSSVVIKANSFTVDATSSITAQGTGYQAGLCVNGASPAAFPLAGGKGGCGVTDGAGGGAHAGGGGRGTKTCGSGGCTFPADWEEDCVGAVAGSGTACVSVTDCRDYNALPTVAGLPFTHTPYVLEYGAAGGDKGCRDSAGFTPSSGTTVATAGGSGGGRIVLMAANAGQTGTMNIAGTVNANGNRGCASGDDTGGGGAGGSVLLIGDTVTISATAVVSARGGQGGDVLAKSEVECTGTQMTGTCSQCGGGGGGGYITVLSRVASVNPLARFDVGGGMGGGCPACTVESAGSVGRLQVDGAYRGEVCDNLDNDFNGAADDGLPQLNCGGTMLPSCVNGVPQTCPANVPACIMTETDTRARVLILVDSSSKGLADTGGRPTFGDGTVGHVGADTSSDADAVDGNNSLLFMMKAALNDVMASAPGTDFALARFHQDVSVNRSCVTANWMECAKAGFSYDDPRNNVSPAYPAVPGCNPQTLYSAGYPAALNANINIGWPTLADCVNYAGTCLGDARRGADILVGFGKPLQQKLKWLDGKETNFNSSILQGDHCNFAGGGDCELRAGGTASIASSLDAAADWLKPILQCDGARTCRPTTVVLLTLGAEQCDGNPVASATALKSVVAGVTVKTYVVAINVQGSETAQMNAIAAAGGTSTAFFASDRSGITNALVSILSGNAAKVEMCDDVDNDCDSLTDESYPDKGQPCDNGLMGVCRGTGVRTCNGANNGTTCSITVPGTVPSQEICDGKDNNCNGLTDEGGVCQVCSPSPETCNGLDDDCNGIADDNPVDVNKPCGSSRGECVQGLSSCNAGQLECPGETKPVDETCNGLDDDCDGLVDGMTRSCGASPQFAGVGVCRLGLESCVSVVGSGVEAWGACLGAVSPSSEVCDGLDNDCNSAVDDHVPDGFGQETGGTCCPFGARCGVGVCTSGAYACSGSSVVCDGAVGPSAEFCDGLDNDCDSIPDNVTGRGTACVMAGGCPGVLDCAALEGLVCVPASSLPEMCNGLDDDCDGSVDEEPDVGVADTRIGVACDVLTAPNDAAPCHAGTTQCRRGQVSCGGSTVPQEERCDGLDNDCDGDVDGPEPCPTGAVCRQLACRMTCDATTACPGGEACMDGVCMPRPDAGMPEPSSSSSQAGSSGEVASSSAGPSSAAALSSSVFSSSAATTASSGISSSVMAATSSANSSSAVSASVSSTATSDDGSGGGGATGPSCGCSGTQDQAGLPGLVLGFAAMLVITRRRRS